MKCSADLVVYKVESYIIREYPGENGWEYDSDTEVIQCGIFIDESEAKKAMDRLYDLGVRNINCVATRIHPSADDCEQYGTFARAAAEWGALVKG